MIKLVLGEKGKGKTKYLLDNANKESKESDGLVIYLDKNSEHMFQLAREVRLINVREYPVASAEVLYGFISGLVAGNSDIVSIYLDSFLKLANIEKENVACELKKLLVLSERLNVVFTVSLSINEAELPEEYKEYISLSL